jgi:hypothetical protein
VAVYEVLVKLGQSVCRCGLEEERNRRSIEVPTWMFEVAVCGRLRVMTAPAVSTESLRALQALLRTMSQSVADGVLQAQHRSLPAAGGADAPVRDSPATLATHTLHPVPSPYPTLKTMPPEIQARTIRLLARLLREHVAHGVAAGAAREARDE